MEWGGVVDARSAVVGFLFVTTRRGRCNGLYEKSEPSRVHSDSSIRMQAQHAGKSEYQGRSNTLVKEERSAFYYDLGTAPSSRTSSGTQASSAGAASAM